tara:strand:- start:44 stop:175 length:132 start_codon:yes stop_codon:yes gene_type:complete
MESGMQITTPINSTMNMLALIFVRREKTVGSGGFRARALFLLK